LNTTIGLLGVFDVASAMGIEREREDFGQVLGVWGVDTGPYLMLPALGPSDIRSFTGRIVDNYYWPSTVLEDPYLIAASVVSVIEARASLLEQEEILNRSLDPYLFVRDAYFQRLAFEVSDGEIEQKSDEELEEEQDDFSDFEDLLVCS
jgi:phospholipid-binding lipoprotein MlaA